MCNGSLRVSARRRLEEDAKRLRGHKRWNKIPIMNPRVETLLAGAMAASFFVLGCATAANKPDVRKEFFLRQLAQTRPVKEHGYSVEDLRFSKDGQKVLVVFAS